MPSPEEAFSTLDDFLLSLAEGISQAQAELARAGSTGVPGTELSYRLPKVEFELRMNLQVVDSPALSNRYAGRLRTARPSQKHLLFRPLAAQEASSTLQIAAQIRGAFVAVPANNGLPPTLLSTAVDGADPSAPILRVLASNAASEPVANLQVEVNLDREESAVLTAASGGSFVLADGTGLRRNVLVTDASGAAEVVLDIDASQQPATLALVIDAAGQTETLVYGVDA
ncbi:MAG: hypothetical protein OEZ06_01780 [Myxococcales bacterium]|nr:hypothetical protein [Myxococcales bacterium]